MTLLPAFAAPASLRTSSLSGVSLSASATSPRRHAQRVAARSAPRAGLLKDKYGDLRGRKVESLGDAMARFNGTFGRPVPIVFRGLVNEIVGSTHLSRSAAMWRYCGIFAFGIDDVFSGLMKGYPGDEEKEALWGAVMDGLRFESKEIRGDADTVRKWLEGKKEADVFEAARSGDGLVGQALAAARDGEKVYEWYYSRMFGFGLVRIMEIVGVELSVAAAERWAKEIGISGGKFATEMGSYLSIQEKMGMAEQMFAEVNARDARKTAERLEEKAQKAKDIAAKLEDGQDVDEFGETVEKGEKEPVAAGDE